jgi:hypothetical protein
MSDFTVGTENGAKERSMRIRLHSLLAWLIARGYHLIGVPTLNHQARIPADEEPPMTHAAQVTGVLTW